MRWQRPCCRPCRGNDEPNVEAHLKDPESGKQAGAYGYKALNRNDNKALAITYVRESRLFGVDSILLSSSVTEREIADHLSMTWLIGTAAERCGMHERMRPGNRKRRAYSRLFLARQGARLLLRKTWSVPLFTPQSTPPDPLPGLRWRDAHRHNAHPSAESDRSFANRCCRHAHHHVTGTTRSGILAFGAGKPREACAREMVQINTGGASDTHAAARGDRQRRSLRLRQTPDPRQTASPEKLFS